MLRKLLVLAAAPVAALMVMAAPTSAHQAAPKKVTVTWYHICEALNHSLCVTANGAGPNLTAVNSGANKWQAIPDNGPIEWQNGSGNCMKSTDTGNITIVNAPCDGGGNKDWTVGGSGNLTFHSHYGGGYMGVENGQPNTAVTDGNPPNWNYGWVTEPA